MGCRRGDEHEKRDVTGAVVGEVPRQRRERSGPPPGLLQGRAGTGLDRGLALVDTSGRQLPTPGVGDEAVPPEQQHAAVGIVDDHTGGLGRHPQHVVFEPGSARQFDIDEREPQPLAVVAVRSPCTVHSIDRSLRG